MQYQHLPDARRGMQFLTIACHGVGSRRHAVKPAGAVCMPKNAVLCKGPGCGGRKKPVDYCGRPKGGPRKSAKCQWFYKVGGWRSLTFPIDPRARTGGRAQEIRVKKPVLLQGADRGAAKKPVVRCGPPATRLWLPPKTPSFVRVLSTAGTASPARGR